MTGQQWDIWRERPDGWSELVVTIEAPTGPDALHIARERGIEGALWTDYEDENDLPVPIRE